MQFSLAIMKKCDNEKFGLVFRYLAPVLLSTTVDLTSVPLSTEVTNSTTNWVMAAHHLEAAQK